MKKLLTVLLINIAFVCSVFAQVDVGIPQGKVQVIDDFENGNYWIWAGSDWDRYGGHKASWGCHLSQKHVTQGHYSMELLLEPAENGTNAVWFYDGSQDLSGGKYIVMDIYNATPVKCKVSIVIQATDNWTWLETPSYEITPGKHRVVFDTSKINSDFNDVRRINVDATLHGKTKEDSSLFIDNILLIK